MSVEELNHLANAYLGGLAHVHTRLSNYPGHRESDQVVSSYVRWLRHHRLAGRAGDPWQYLIITNHVSNPVGPKRLSGLNPRLQLLARRHWRSRRNGIPVLYGFEASLLPGGYTDLSPALSAHAELVIGSMHGGHNGHDAKAWQGVLERALDRAEIDVLGHPLRGLADPLGIDWRSVLELAASRRIAIEVNVNSLHLVVGDAAQEAVWHEWLGLVASSGCRILLGYDLHNQVQLDRLADDWQGLHDLRRPNGLRAALMGLDAAGIEPERVVNREIHQLLAWRRQRRGGS